MAVFNYIVEIKENDIWTEHMQWLRPLSDKETLDESLDEGGLKLGLIPRKNVFAPFTPVRISIFQVNGQNNIEKLNAEEREHYLVDKIYRLTSTCSVEQKAFAHNGIGEDLYTHTIQLIELSKELEREICDTLTFTNYLGRDFISGSEPVNYRVDKDLTGGILPPIVNPANYLSPIIVGKSFTFSSAPAVFNVFDMAQRTRTFSIEIRKGSTIIHSQDYSRAEQQKSFTTSIENLGKETYKVKYFLKNDSMAESSLEISYEFATVVEVFLESKLTHSVSKVIKRILSAGITHREGIDKQKYFLDPIIEEKYKMITAPEVHITRCTLFEALAEVGNYIHAIPRLLWNPLTDKADIITFDELGKDEKYILPEGVKILAYNENYNADDYCNVLDSTAENLLNTRNKQQGSVIEPFYNGFITPRSEEIQITDDTAIILTKYPIYRIDKLEVINTSKTGEEVSDITPYVYESAEYGILSSFGGQFPYTTACALKYTQGDNKIANFMYKQSSENNIAELYKTPVIKNILKRLGKTYTGVSMQELAFRITYIPSVSLRATAKKVYKENKKQTSLLYNQSASTVESESYGENLKGVIARLGNAEKTITFMIDDYAKMPRVGQKFEDYYIASVCKEFELDKIKVSLYLSKDFNRLAQYLGLHTNYRLFDVSEKQSAERFVNYGEDVCIGDIENTDTLSGITANGVNLFRNIFSQNSMQNQVTCALIKSVELVKNNVLGCISVALGNSLAFNCRFEDNFSSGCKSVPADGSKRATQLVPYGDIYGEMKKMSVKFYNTLSDVNNKSAYDNLPEYYGNENNALFDFSAYPFIIEKDSRECINFCFQQHFVSNRKSVVIGAQLSQNNPLVTQGNTQKSAKLYLLPYELNMLNSIFVLSNGAKLDIDLNSLLPGIQDKQFFINEITNKTNQTYNSWALMEEIFDENDIFTGYGKLYVGENIELKPNEKSKKIYFTFKSNKELTINKSSKNG